jgi:hypothetical protein
LVESTSYKFKVSASNSLGESPLSQPLLVIAADMPSKPPTPPTATLITETSVTLQLTALDSDQQGGSEVTGYLVEVDDGLGGAYSIVHNSLSLDLILTKLEPARFYRIRYAARNVLYDQDNMYECDQLQYSDPLTVHTAVLPSEPENLAHSTDLRYRDALVFSWEAPLSDGSSNLKEYTLELYKDSSLIET